MSACGSSHTNVTGTDNGDALDDVFAEVELDADLAHRLVHLWLRRHTCRPAICRSIDQRAPLNGENRLRNETEPCKEHETETESRAKECC